MKSQVKKYGKTSEEVRIEKLAECRQIVKQVIDFGVNEDQKRQIIYLMSLELEDVSIMKKISKLLKSNEETLDKNSKLLLNGS